MIAMHNLFQEVKFQIPISLAALSNQHIKNNNMLSGQTSMNNANRIANPGIATKSPNSNMARSILGQGPRQRRNAHSLLG